MSSGEMQAIWLGGKREEGGDIAAMAAEDLFG